MIATRISRPLVNRATLALILGVSAAGCAVFTDHNDNIEEGYEAFKQGRFAQAIEAFKEDRDNNLDGLCFRFDSGMIHHVAGNYKASIAEFEAAKVRMGGFDDRATVNVRDIAETGASFLVNEKTIPYKGEDFERVLLPAVQARNYLLLGDLEGAAVEARRCIFQQKLVRQKYETELDEARKTEQEKRNEAGSVDTSSYFSTVQNECQVPQAYLNSTQNVYDLCFVNYLISVLLEAQGDDQNARVFAQRALDLQPGSGLLRRDRAHIEEIAGDLDRANEMAQSLGVSLPSRQDGSLVVFYDSGEAPLKVEKYIVFPTGGFGFQKFALPFYQSVNNPAAAVELDIGGQTLRTEALTSVEQVAFRYFNDRMPLIVTKAIIRVIAKIVAQKAAEYVAQQQGDLLVQAVVGLGTSAVMSLTEQADLRAWRTLPQTLQAGRIYLPEGQYPVTLKLLSSGGGAIATRNLGTATIKSGQIGFVCLRSVGSNFWGAASPNLELVGAPQPAAPQKKKR